MKFSKPSLILFVTLALPASAFVSPASAFAFGGAKPSADNKNILPPQAMGIPNRLLVLAPHPDDIMLSSGLAQATLQHGGEVRIVDLTSGDSKSLPGIAYVKRRGFHEHSNSAINYGMYRQIEDREAVRHIGVDPDRSVFLLGYPDGGLWDILKAGACDETDLSLGGCDSAFFPYESPSTRETHVPYANAVRPDVAYLRRNVVIDIAKMITDFQPDLIVATHPNDIHPDHAANYFFTIEAMRLAGVSKTVPLYIPLDTYAGKLPTHLRKDLRYRPPTKVLPSATVWSELELTEEMRLSKIELVSTYRSQMAWEHPLDHDYEEGFKSYMFGYIAVNELYGTITNAKYDEKFRKKAERREFINRGKAVVGNTISDLLRRLF